MDTRQLASAVAVAEELNFTRASARLRISQSGISHQIGELERELGTRLFERTSRSVALTPAGLVFVPWARRTLAGLAETRAEIAASEGRLQGSLRLSTVTLTAGDLDVLGVLRTFQRTHPDVEVTMLDAGSVTAAQLVADGEVDVALATLHDHQLPSGLLAHVLRTVPLVLVVGREHRLRGSRPVALSDLTDERFLDAVPDTGLRAQVDAAFSRARARRRGVCALRGAGDLSSLAMEGIGVTVVPLPVATATVAADAEGCVVRLADPAAVLPLVLCHRQPEPASANARAFLRLALRHLR